MLARATNFVQKALASGKYQGALWLEGSPSVEDTSYWLSLTVDTTLPLTANSAHRHRGLVSADGDGNILDSIEYILSRVWADDEGRNRLGTVMVQDEIIYSAREVVKGDAHPGGYFATGGYGGIFGSMTAGPYVTNIPTRKHTWKSEVRVTQLPTQINGVLKQGGAFKSVPVPIKNAAGELLLTAIPKVTILKGDVWFDDRGIPDEAAEKGIEAGSKCSKNIHWRASSVKGSRRTEHVAVAGQSAGKSGVERIAGGEDIALGDVHGLVKVNDNNLFIEGNNLIATKARLLLTAAIMKFGPLPHAADPEHPTAAEIAAIKAMNARYQEVSRLTEPPVTPKPLPAHEVHERPAASGRRVRAGRGRG